jgi:pimeloyl-ACP methyl ester carboxylesterase
MTLRSPADEIHFPTTPDGWRIALHRHRPRRVAATAPTPVILCPGYGCSHRFVDFDERSSLARHLAAHGFDAWVVDLRGRGLSRPTPAAARPWSWTFDDLAVYDVGTAIAHVAGTTGRRVAWVGHSMGGMLLYAHLVLRDDPRVLAAVTIAAPVEFPTASNALIGRLGEILLDVPFGDTVPQRWALGALWMLLSRTTALDVGMNPENVDRRLIGRALPASLADVSRAKLRQFASWSQRGVFRSADDTVDYRAGLSRVRTPLLLVAGAMDRLATPASVQRALDFLPPGEATYREFGRAHGHTIDYGHVDLVLGRRAPAEVFPEIARWLVTHAEETP